jgi:hypothetical protein
MLNELKFTFSVNDGSRENFRLLLYLGVDYLSNVEFTVNEILFATFLPL